MSNFKSEIKNLKSEILDFLFPLHCVGCDTLGSAFCTSCLTAVPLRDPGCLVCSARNRSGTFCPPCKHHLPFLTRIVWAASYETESVARALTQFKYHGNHTLAEPLSTLIVTSLKKRVQEQAIRVPENVLLLPLPLHPRKKRARGYNQSALLAFFMQSALAIPLLAESTLIRIKNTSPQAQCAGGRDARRKNIEYAFLVPPRAYSSVRDKTIFLVDDIATTGSTLHDAARALKTAGARHVWGIVVARG